MMSPAFKSAPLIAASSAAFMLLTAGLASAQTSKKLELTVANGEVLEIPLDTSKPAGVRGNGNIHAACQLANNRCPGIGSNVTLPPGPAITVSSPTEGAVIAATDTSASLVWSAPQAQTCYGLSVTPDIAQTAGWKKEWGRTGTFQIGNLPRNSSDNRDYSFTLRCYAASSGGAAAYTDITRNFKLAPSTAPGPGPNPPSGDACQQYMAQHGLQPNVNGFQPSGLSAHIVHFDSGVFSTPGGTLLNFNDMLANRWAGRAVLPALPRTGNQYLSIKIDVNQSLAPQKGFMLTWSEAQDGGLTTKPGTIELTLSPCPGDFRPRPAGNSNTLPDFWNRAYCKRKIVVAGGPMYFLGNGTGQPGNVCYIPSPSSSTPGTQTVYLNITTHNMDVFRANGSADGNAAGNNTCTSGNRCGFRFDIAPIVN